MFRPVPDRTLVSHKPHRPAALLHHAPACCLLLIHHLLTLAALHLRHHPASPLRALLFRASSACASVPVCPARQPHSFKASSRCQVSCCACRLHPAARAAQSVSGPVCSAARPGLHSTVTSSTCLLACPRARPAPALQTSASSLPVVDYRHDACTHVILYMHPINHRSSPHVISHAILPPIHPHIKPGSSTHS